MGKQSSRIIWGKIKKNPDDSGYNLVEITDYDPENIYTSGNIVIANEYGQDEEGYRAYQCIASEAAGDFSTYDTWKLLKGIYTLVGTGKYIPDTKAEEIVYSKRLNFKPGSKVVKKDIKDNMHYLYKCIEENNVHYEGFNPDKWEKEFQRVGIAFIPCDHKEVYYDNGRNAVKWHKAMWFMPEEQDVSSSQDISFYDGSYDLDDESGIMDYNTEYFKGERVIYKGRYPHNDDLWLYEYTHNSFIGGVSPTDHYYFEIWKHIEDVSEHNISTDYKKGDMVIAYYESSVDRPISTYDENLNYSISQYIIKRIKPDNLNPVSKKDLDILSIYTDGYIMTEISDYLKESGIPNNKYTPITSRARAIELNDLIYGAYIAVKDTNGEFDEDDWLLVPDIRHWDNAVNLQIVAQMALGRLVIWNMKDSSDYIVYECIKEHTIIKEAGTSDEYLAKLHRPDISPDYWRPLYQRHRTSNSHKVYKAVRDNRGQFVHNDWVIVTQNKHENLRDYGYIWRKLSDSPGGGVPFFGIMPIFKDVYIASSSYRWTCQIRFNDIKLYLGNNVLNLGQVLSCTHDRSNDMITGSAASTLVQVGNTVYGYLDGRIASVGGIDNSSKCNYILVLNKNKKFKKITFNEEELYYYPGRVDFYGLGYGLCSNNTILYMKITDIWHPEQGVYSNFIEFKRATLFPDTATYTIDTIYSYNEWDLVYISIGSRETITGGLRYAVSNYDNKFYMLMEYIPSLHEWHSKNTITSEIVTVFEYSLIVTKYHFFNGAGNEFIGPFISEIKDYNYKKIVALPYTDSTSLWYQYLSKDDDVGTVERTTYLRTSVWPYVKYLTADDKTFLDTIGATYNQDGTSFTAPFFDIYDNAELDERPVYDTHGNLIHFEYDPVITEIQLPHSDGNSYIILNGFFAPFKKNFSMYTKSILLMTVVTYANNSTYEVVNTMSQPMFYDGPYTNMPYFLGDFGDTVFFYTDDYCLFYVSYHAVQSIISSGIWKLDFNTRQLSRLYEVYQTNPLLLYKAGCVWKIPYYRNQTCHIQYGPGDFPEEGMDIQYLILQYGRFVINEYDRSSWANDNSDFPYYEGHVKNKIWNVHVGLPTLTPNFATDSGNPISGKNDINITTKAFIYYSNDHYISVTLCVALPNFRSCFDSDNLNSVTYTDIYNPVLNGAFFWIASNGASSCQISPMYGGPEDDAQGFSGW